MSSTKVWIADRWKGAKTGTGLRWRVVWIDPDTNRERSQSYKKKPDAEAHQTFMENSLRENSYTSPEVGAMTVADAVEAWMNSKKNPGEASRSTYRDRIDNYVLPRWGKTRLSAVRRTDVDTWVFRPPRRLSAPQGGRERRTEALEARDHRRRPRTVHRWAEVRRPGGLDQTQSGVGS